MQHSMTVLQLSLFVGTHMDLTIVNVEPDFETFQFLKKTEIVMILTSVPKELIIVTQMLIVSTIEEVIHVFVVPVMRRRVEFVWTSMSAPTLEQMIAIEKVPSVSIIHGEVI